MKVSFNLLVYLLVVLYGIIKAHNTETAIPTNDLLQATLRVTSPINRDTVPSTFKIIAGIDINYNVEESLEIIEDKISKLQICYAISSEIKCNIIAQEVLVSDAPTGTHFFSVWITDDISQKNNISNVYSVSINVLNDAYSIQEEGIHLKPLEVFDYADGINNYDLSNLYQHRSYFSQQKPLKRSQCPRIDEVQYQNEFVSDYNNLPLRTVFLLIGIKSSPSNFEERKALRETWFNGLRDGVGCPWFIIYLEPDLSLNKNLMSRVVEENSRFRDMLIYESKTTVSTSHMVPEFMHFVSKNFHFNYLSILDDNVYLDLNKLVLYLENYGRTTKYLDGQFISESISKTTTTSSTAHFDYLSEEEQLLAHILRQVSHDHYIVSSDLVSYVSKNRKLLKILSIPTYSIYSATVENTYFKSKIKEEDFHFNNRRHFDTTISISNLSFEEIYSIHDIFVKGAIEDGFSLEKKSSGHNSIDYSAYTNLWDIVKRLDSQEVIIIGFSAQAFYLIGFVGEMFLAIFQHQEIRLVPYTAFAEYEVPDIFINTPLDGGCYKDWTERCQNTCKGYMKAFPGAIYLLWSGEAWDLSSASEIGFHGIIHTVNDRKLLPFDIPSLYIPTICTAFTQMQEYSPLALFDQKSFDDHSANGKLKDVAYMYNRCVDRDLREYFFDVLVDKGIEVDALGACRGHNSQPDNTKNADRHASGWHDEAVKKYEDYKFVIAFENSVSEGYITEKIATAMLAGAIPIYFGPRDIENVFNKESFVYCGDSAETLDRCAEKVKNILGNETLYQNIRSEEWLSPSSKFKDICKWQNDLQSDDGLRETFLKFLYGIGKNRFLSIYDQKSLKFMIDEIVSPYESSGDFKYSSVYM